MAAPGIRDFSGPGLLEAMFRLSLDPLCVTDAQGFVRRANPALARLLDRPGEEVEGASLLSFVHPDDRQAVLTALVDRLARNEPAVRLTARCLTSGGEERVVEWALQPDPRQGCTFAVARDRTGRHRAESAYRDLVERSLQGITVLQDGRVVFANQAFARMTGFPREDIEALSAAGGWDRIHPDDRPLLRTVFASALSGEPVIDRAAFRFRRRDGSWAWLETQAGFTLYRDRPAIQAFFQDVTTAVETEEALRRSEERLRAILETVPAAVTLVDPGGTVLFANAMAETVHGAARDAIVGRRFDDEAWRITDFQGRPFPARELPFARVRDTGRPVAGVEHALEAPDGGRRFLSINASPLFDGRGRLDAVVACVSDVTERERALAALRRERNRAQHYLDVAGVMLVALDTEGRVTLANRTACELLGVAEHEAVGRDWFAAFLPADLRDEGRALFGRLLGGRGGGSERVESRVLAARGGERRILWRNAVLRDEEGRATGTLGSGLDVTEERQAQEALRTAAERLELALDAADAAVYDHALPMDETAYFSPRWAEILGYRPEDLPAPEAMFSWWRERMHTEDRKAVTAAWRRFAGGREETFRAEYRWRLPDGGYRWLESMARARVRGPGGRARRVVGFVRDITPRKRMAEELRRSREALALFVETGGEPMGVYDRDGTLLMMNRAAARLLGGRPEHFTGRDLGAFLPGAEIARRRIRRVFETGRAETHEDEMELGGRRRWLRTACRPLRNDEEEIYAVQLTSLDITERREAEEALRSGEERYRRLVAYYDRVREEERSRLSREVHDEIGGELTVLGFDLAWLAGRLPPDGPEAEKVRGLRRRLEQTVGRVQRVARSLRPGMLDDLGLEAALEWQADDFREHTGLACGLDLPGEELPLRPEQATALFRIFQEALTNVARHAGARAVEARLRRGPGYVTLTVHDDGRGITRRQAADPSSMGLAGMRERARQLGGDIDVSGMAGRGTTLSVTLPLFERREP